jgi:thioredoxin reductase
MPDVIIIGDGPAGLAAALFLAKNGLGVEVYGKNGSWVNHAMLKNYLGVSPIEGPDFLRRAREQVSSLGAVLIDAEVETLTDKGDAFEVKTTEGKVAEARYLVLAGGPKSALVKQLGFEVDKKGYAQADRSGRTKIDRAYVAGWSTRADKVQAQISAGDGAAVALDILSREKGKDFHDFDEIPEGD